MFGRSRHAPAPYFRGSDAALAPIIRVKFFDKHNNILGSAPLGAPA